MRHTLLFLTLILSVFIYSSISLVEKEREADMVEQQIKDAIKLLNKASECFTSEGLTKGGTAVVYTSITAAKTKLVEICGEDYNSCPVLKEQ